MERFIARSLSGLRPSWNHKWSIDDFMLCCELHGTAAIFADKYSRGMIADIPEAFGPKITAYLDFNHVFEILHHEQIEKLLCQLQDIPVIVLKGTALAYTIYPDPKLRTRSDTDLLINPEDIDSVHEHLLNLGYEASLSSSVDLRFYQRSYVLRDPLDYLHIIDVHWRLNNKQIIASLFTWQELFQHSHSPSSFPGPGRLLDNAYNLLLLCLHRVGHIYSNRLCRHSGDARDRLLWFYDIYLLGEQFSDSDWCLLAALSEEKQVCQLVLDTLQRVTENFPLNVPEAVIQRLACGRTSEAARLLLSPSELQRLKSDLLALPSVMDRFKLIKEILLPPPGYMLQRYERNSIFWLLYLYPARLLGMLH